MGSTALYPNDYNHIQTTLAKCPYNIYERDKASQFCGHF